MIQVKVDSVQVSLMSEHRVVVLRDLSSERFLPVWIGAYEAEAIVIGLNNYHVARPLTHDLLDSVISSLDGQVQKVIVSDMKDDTYYAHIVVDRNGSEIEIDSRPSDAIALAVRAQAPLFVKEEVMAKFAIAPEPDVREGTSTEIKASAFRDFVNSLDLDDLPLH
jgi:bifunctional DNase/RNase